MVEEDRPTARIVVGVDGSESSRKALRWALTQARRQNAAVEAITGWTFPATSSWIPVPASDLEAAARQALADTVEQERHTAPEVPLDTRIAQGHPAHVLVDTANGADLLVVGCRGLGGLTGTLLGSVSRYCVEHATCPVVVMRDTEGPHPGQQRRASPRP
ncbi:MULTISPECIES: universal stress protein [unclassified Streptomyces]|uniref:universal stress protein n=1 Tax=unclassified Streptomyces TaxID=2593676 RepID=UPI003654836A